MIENSIHSKRATIPVPHPFGLAKFSLGQLWLGTTLLWLLFVVLSHVFGTYTLGPKALPFGPARFAWINLVNAALLGLVIAGHATLKRGVAQDLEELRPILPPDREAFESDINRIANLSRPIRRVVIAIGLMGGLAVATLDPSLRDLNDHLSLFDPRYLCFVLQNLLFALGGTYLFAVEVHMTRAYARLGEVVRIDLLEPSTLLVFGRKGLRSSIVWALISTVFSMFWVLDSAGQANIALAVAVLGLATAAVVAPTSGVRRNVAIAKQAELVVVSRAIRQERDRALAPRCSETRFDDSRMGNLLQYQAFIKSVREWPFDFSILSRSSLFILLGAGSWLGGAVAERILNDWLA